MQKDDAERIMRRDALKLLLGLSLAPCLPVTGRAHGVLQPIRMGIQVFTGAVATIWYEKRIYERRGLMVEARTMADGRSVRDAVVGNQLNAGTMNITPFIVGASVSSITMVGVVSLGGDTVGLMIRKGSGMNTVADLKGRKIGISTGSTTANIFLQTVLPEAGLRREDVLIVNMKPADQVAALSTGSVDAITSFEPYLSVAEKEGIGAMLLRFGKIDPNPTCLVLSGALIEQSPETVRAFLKSWQDGVDYWNSHTAEVAETIHQMYAGAGYANVTRAMAENIVRQIKVEPDITPALAAHIRAEGERLKAANLVKTLPDWDKVLRADLLPAARA